MTPEFYFPVTRVKVMVITLLVLAFAVLAPAMHEQPAHITHLPGLRLNANYRRTALILRGGAAGDTVDLSGDGRALLCRQVPGLRATCSYATLQLDTKHARLCRAGANGARTFTRVSCYPTPAPSGTGGPCPQSAAFVFCHVLGHYMRAGTPIPSKPSPSNKRNGDMVPFFDSRAGSTRGAGTPVHMLLSDSGRVIES